MQFKWIALNHCGSEHILMGRRYKEMRKITILVMALLVLLMFTSTALAKNSPINGMATGGGTIHSSCNAAKLASFGFTALNQNGAARGNMALVDQPCNFVLRGDVTSFRCSAVGSTRRAIFSGPATVNGRPGFRYSVTVQTVGQQPLIGAILGITVVGPSGNIIYQNVSPLVSGNIHITCP